MPSERRGSARTNVTERVARLIDAVVGARRRLSLKEIAGLTDLPMSTAHRLMSELTLWGAFDRDEDRRYGIGPHLLELAAEATPARVDRAVLAPGVARVFAATGRQVFVAVPDGRGGVTVVEELHPPREDQLVVLGQRLDRGSAPARLVRALAGAPDGPDADPPGGRAPEVSGRVVVSAGPVHTIVAAPLRATGAGRGRALPVYGAITIVYPTGSATADADVRALTRGAQEISEDLAWDARRGRARDHVA